VLPPLGPPAYHPRPRDVIASCAAATAVLHNLLTGLRTTHRLRQLRQLLEADQAACTALVHWGTGPPPETAQQLTLRQGSGLQSPGLVPDQGCRPPFLDTTVHDLLQFLSSSGHHSGFGDALLPTAGEMGCSLGSRRTSRNGANNDAGNTEPMRYAPVTVCTFDL
jgi:hypothetical protein